MEKKTRAFGFFLLAFALALPLAYADSSSTGAITFHSGWNMISVPVDLKITMASVADTCGTAAYAWRMDPGGYVQTDTLEPGHGYWIKGTKDCHYQVGVTSKTSSLSSLFTGWNIVGAYSDTVSLSDVKNNCVITAGPWHYNPSINNYEYSSTLAPSQAYWIKVSSPCTLSANDQPPTPPNPPNSTNFFSSDPSMGPSGASVTVTEFADFQCPYCDIVHGRSTGGSQYDSIRGTEPKIIANYANTGKVRFTYHIMAFLGQESIDAANAALCVREVGGDTGFFAMQDKLFDNQASSENSGVFSKANLKAYASAIGYSSAQVADCINSGKYNSQVQQSNTDAGSMGVQGTPTFTVNGVQTASTDYATVKAAIDSALGSPSGTEPLSVSCPVESATAGVYYSSSASASGGSGGYTYSITGALPSGVTAAGASVSGTPTASSGSYFYTVLVTDGAGNTKSKSCYITISATADTTLPSISVSADPDSGNVYTVTAIASDASGISSITVYSAQGTFGDHEVFTSKTCSSSPCQFATGGSNQYVYYATATDASPNHNVATATMQLFTITSGVNPTATTDTTQPSISVSADPDSGNVYTVTATASDASGISSITIYSAQGTLGSHGAFTTKTCSSSPCQFATGGSNSYVYYATATDASEQHNTATTDMAAFAVPS